MKVRKTNTCHHMANVKLNIDKLRIFDLKMLSKTAERGNGNDGGKECGAGGRQVEI